MGAVVDAAASVTPPDVVYVRASVTSEEALKINTIARNAYLSVQAQGLDLHLRVVGLPVGSAAPSVNTTNVSSVSSNVPAVATSGTWIVYAGTTDHFDCRDIPEGQDIWLVHIASATTGFIRFRRSSGPA